jgi:hypothetical protein
VNPADQLRIPEPVASITTVWPSEAQHFTPWLADHLEVLDILGLGRLELVQREKQVPGTLRSLDLLVQGPTGDQVAIENQYGKQDHDHLTRGLAYAVGLGTQALVVIAEDHLNEFRAVARYLNDVADRSEADTRIRVYLVQVRVEQVEDFYLPRFDVVESPNPWAEEVAEAREKQLPLASLDAFLEDVVIEAREAATELCRWWDDGIGTMRFTSRSVSLDRPHPMKRGQVVSHFVVYTNGSTWLNRGYILAAYGEDASDEFDVVVTAALPELKFGEKRYYLTSPFPLPVPGVKAVIDWLDGRAVPHATPTN